MYSVLNDPFTIQYSDILIFIADLQLQVFAFQTYSCHSIFDLNFDAERDVLDDNKGEFYYNIILLDKRCFFPFKRRKYPPDYYE